jgi:hypothetical protein
LFWTATKAILHPCLLLPLLGVLCDHALISCLPALGLWLALQGISLALHLHLHRPPTSHEA